MTCVVVASDHAGYKLKQVILGLLKELNIETVDFGAFSDSQPADDYMLIGAKAAHYVVECKADYGILICGTGIGMSIAANKVHGVRAALCNDLFTARKSREHNDANILALGARLIGDELAKEIVRLWLATSYEFGRHEARNETLKQIEAECSHPLFP